MGRVVICDRCGKVASPTWGVIRRKRCKWAEMEIHFTSKDDFCAYLCPDCEGAFMKWLEKWLKNGQQEALAKEDKT